MYQSLIRRRRDQGFKIYKLKGNLSWLRVLQTVCNLYVYFFIIIIIIRDEFEFDDLKYCVLISVLRFTFTAKYETLWSYYAYLVNMS